MKRPLNLFFAGICGFASLVQMASTKATTVWLKDQNNASNWPQGFNIPQPGPGQLTITNGLLQTSSDTAFDGFMRTYAGPGVIVYLSPGTFVTFGMYNNYLPQNWVPGWRLQDGSQLHGAGKTGANQTIIKVVGVNSNFGATAIGSNQLMPDEVTQTTYHNIWVTDLAVDCNASNIINGDLTKLWQFAGVELYGAGSMHIENVSVANAAGGYLPPPPGTRQEDWILSINSTTTLSSDNWIVGCDVLNFYNPDGKGACSGISLNKRLTLGYIAGTIQNCTVSLNGFTSGQTNGFGTEYAYNGTLWDDVLFQNNTSVGAARAFNNDTAIDLAATFDGNTFNIPPGITNRGNAYGFYLINGATLSRFHDNYFNQWGPYTTGVLISGPSGGYAGANNLLFDYNHFTKVGSWTGTAYGFDLNESDFTAPQQIDIEQNTLDPALSNNLPSSSGLYLRNSGTSFPAFPALNWGPIYPPLRSAFHISTNFDLILQDASINLECASLNGATGGRPAPFNPSQVTQAGWALVGAGDEDRDGKTDLFFQHPTYGICVWAMDGTTMVTTAGGPVTQGGYPLIPGGTWKVVGVADFNGDCKPDLLFQDDSSYLAIWHLDGTSVTSTSMLSPSYSGGIGGGIWRVVGTGDFNHDGWTDILLQYDDVNNAYLDGQLAVWYMHDTSLQSSVFLNPQFPSDVKYRVVATADFYHTQNSSIVFQYKNPRTAWGGSLMSWQMNQINQVHMDTISLNVGSFNVVGPR